MMNDPGAGAELRKERQRRIEENSERILRSSFSASRLRDLRENGGTVTPEEMRPFLPEGRFFRVVVEGAPHAEFFDPVHDRHRRRFSEPVFNYTPPGYKYGPALPTVYPLLTCGRLTSDPGSGSGSLCGPRHLLTVAHNFVKDSSPARLAQFDYQFKQADSAISSPLAESAIIAALSFAPTGRAVFPRREGWDFAVGRLAARLGDAGGGGNWIDPGLFTQYMLNIPMLQTLGYALATTNNPANGNPWFPSPAYQKLGAATAMTEMGYPFAYLATATPSLPPIPEVAPTSLEVNTYMNFTLGASGSPVWLWGSGTSGVLEPRTVGVVARSGAFADALYTQQGVGPTQNNEFDAGKWMVALVTFSRMVWP